MSGLGLQSPWVTFAEELKELFKEDPEIHYEYDGQYEVKLFVDNPEKADALMKLIPPLKVFGNVTLKITIIPADAEDTKDVKALFEKAFEGNPVLSFVETQDNVGAGPVATYVVFENKVVQFFNDDLSDYYRNKSTLYQNIAYDVFGESHGAYFCTDIPADERDDDIAPDEVSGDDDSFDEESGADE